MGLIGFIIILLFLNGIVSFGFASFLRSTGLAIVGSAIVTVMLFLVWGINTAASSNAEDVHDIFLALNITIMFMIPAAIVTSAGFVLLTKREQRKNGPVQMKPQSDTCPEFAKSDHTKL